MPRIVHQIWRSVRGNRTMINPQNQTLNEEEKMKLEKELTMWIENAREIAKGITSDDFLLESHTETLENRLSLAQKCAEKLGRDIKPIVDEIMTPIYPLGIANAIKWAKECKSINPHNARMYLREAKDFARKAGIDITSQIQELETELEPKKPKSELIQEREMPISGVNFVTFEEYRRLGGNLTKEQYEQVKKVRTTQDLCQQALREGREVGGAYPDASQMELLARIIAIAPNKSSFDRVCEMFLLQGKK